jgi:hypothetical protein
MNKEEFNIFINSEIENLRNEIQRPGWTTWALTGALAALVWALISLVEQGHYSLRAVASLLLVISFLDYARTPIQVLISPSLTLQQLRGRIIPARLLSANMPVIVLMVAQLVFITIVISRFSTELGSVATSISFTAVSVLLLSTLIGFVIIIARFPVVFNPRNRGAVAILVVCSGLMLLSVWYHIRFLWISPGGATVYDVRFALVIAAIFFLSMKLISVPRGALTLDVLTNIRREVLLEKIKLETAIEQVDIALTGNRASNLLESYIAKLLSLYRDASAELSKSVSCIAQFEKSLSGTEEKLPPGQLPIKREDMDILTSSIEKAHDIITTDIPRAYKPIGRRMMLLTSMGLLEHSDDLRDLDKKLKTVQADLDEQVKEFTNKYEKLYKAIQRGGAQMS